MPFSRSTKDENVTLAGTPDYITISGQTITRGAIDLATDVTGATPVANGGTGLSAITSGHVLYASGTDTIAAAAPGNTSGVQAYDAETAKTDTAQAWTASQRSTFYTSYADDTATFYMNTAQNWTWTVTASGASSVTFELESGTSALTNANGQSGYILLTNAAGTITLNATTTDVDTDLLTTISGATGTFLLSYICDGSKVYLTNSKALT